MDDLIFKNVLNEFKPILIMYFPHYYANDKTSFFRIEALKNKLGDSFSDKYIFLAIPYNGDDFKLDLLSVVKSKFIKDSDLKKYINQLQESIMEDEKKNTEKTSEVKDFEKIANLLNKVK